MSLRVLLVDDEPVARRGLRRLLTAAPDLEIVGECGDGASAIAAIAELTPDLVLLDVQMPELGGFDVVDAVGLQQLPAIVFVTAYDQYALRAFDVHAVDYVLKPVDPERLQRALERARSRIAARDANGGVALAAALADLGRQLAPRWARRLAIRAGGRVRLVEVGTIQWLRAAGNYVEVHAGGRMQTMRETLAALEARLDPERFVRVSRSALVNLDAVRELQPLFDGDFVLLLHDGTQVPGSRRWRESFERRLR
jgi:two-component system LytT family response regulator